VRAIAEVKQRWSVIGWVTKNLLSRVPLCFGRHDKPLVLAAFTVVSTHQSAARVVVYGPFSFYAIHNEGLCPCSGDINGLMTSTFLSLSLFFVDGHQPINVPISEHKTSLWIEKQKNGPCNPPEAVVDCKCDRSGHTCLPKHGGAQDNIFQDWTLR
jgi:hypothetical protein